MFEFLNMKVKWIKRIWMYVNC